eukprot:TRINITY_DN4654_c0_g1_i2.p1 TRINITY_DN4654_c0_g1~~TRINITY_DN4654_c0_g1_i2.p1  ORF type:complete len:275 (+),score=67.65 TRINITY_DN4654_c0_g1_i2:118-942(+)
MLKLSRFLVKQIPRSEIRLSSTAAQAQPAPAWDLFAVVCLERPPVIVPPLSKMETDMLNLLKEKEFENSFMSDHEMRHMRDLERAQKKGKEPTDEVLDESAMITALDMEDKWKTEAETFTPASIPEVEADNKKSMLRCLDRPVRLCVNTKFGDNTYWGLPEAKRIDGESMRQTAERAVQETCGDRLNFKILGNAPLSFYKKKYPKKYQTESAVGAKFFIFKGYVINRDGALWQDVSLKLGENCVDYNWLTYEELLDRTEHKESRALYNMLHTDD